VWNETAWELLMRRADRNVFAAQVLLGRLKVISGGFALVQFLGMTVPERLQSFQTSLSGRKLLIRASRARTEIGLDILPFSST
jgi:hypothetical protein